jgi:hypothetical protein
MMPTMVIMQYQRHMGRASKQMTWRTDRYRSMASLDHLEHINMEMR